MNNINCEHCGALIDVEKDKKCTNCGAPFKNNKQYKEYQAYQKRQRELNLESQQINNDIKRDVHNTTKKMVPSVFIFVLIVFLISFGVFFFILTRAFDGMDDYNQKYNEYQNNKSFIDELQNNKEKVYIFFNEYAYTERYDIKIDKVINYVEKRFEDNKKLYGFHVVFKNKTPEWKTLDNITLTYINKEGEERSLSKSTVSTKDLDFFATKEITYDGYIYYDIPEEVKDVTFVFEDINITLLNFRSKIK